MTMQELKIWPEYFMALRVGTKRHEVRKNDRDFQVGQDIWWREWSPTLKDYTGYSAFGSITYITPAGTLGLPEDVCVFSVEVVG